MKKHPIAFYPDGMPFSGEDTIKMVRGMTDTILLSFSCGKDSIAAWLQLRDHFRIIPFYMYLVPDLAFVDDSLLYYEDFFEEHIIRVPHPSLYRWINNHTFQSFEHLPIIYAAKLPDFTYDNLSEWIGKEHDLLDIWTASGVRAADSPNRRSSINKNSPITWSRQYFYPIWDMKIAELEALLERHRILLPIDYKLFGRSFDGIDHRFIHIIKKKLPDDYQKILNWFPMIELELMRYEL